MAVNLNLDGMSSKQFKPINRFKVQDGTNVFRILPPFGTEHENKASREVNLHWGFVTSDGKQRPVVCSYHYEKFCPICQSAKSTEGEAERAKLMGNDDEYKELIKKAQDLRNRKTFLYNAANKQGDMGVLELTKTSHEAVIELFTSYIKKYDKDPTSLKDGVWLEINREGKGFKTKYTVSLHRVTLRDADGEIVEKLDRSPLAENILNNYEKNAVDIHSLYKPVLAADLQRILDGEPVDKVLARSEKPKQAAAQEAPPEEEDAFQEPAPTPAPKAAAPIAAAKPAAKAAAPAPKKVEPEDDEIDFTQLD